MMAAVDVMTRRRRKRPNVAVMNIRKQGRVCRVPAPIHVSTAMTHDTGGNASAIGDGELDHGLELLGSEGLNQRHYYQKKLQVAEGWDKLRVEAIHAVVEGLSLAPGTKCCNCLSAAAQIRCLQCGPTFFLCKECTIALHTNGCHFSHTTEIWKV